MLLLLAHIDVVNLIIRIIFSGSLLIWRLLIVVEMRGSLFIRLGHGEPLRSSIVLGGQRWDNLIVIRYRVVLVLFGWAVMLRVIQVTAIDNLVFPPNPRCLPLFRQHHLPRTPTLSSFHRIIHQRSCFLLILMISGSWRPGLSLRGIPFFRLVLIF